MHKLGKFVIFAINPFKHCVMILLETNSLNNVKEFTIQDCTIYQTTCDDKYFINIIDKNKEILEGEFALTNYLFVLIDNMSIFDRPNRYASISFRERKRGEDIIFEVCVVIVEDRISLKLFKDFLLLLFQNLSLVDNLRIAFSSNLDEPTWSLFTEEHINICSEKMIEELKKEGLNL